MAALRLALVLCVLTALQADVVPLSFFEIPDSGAATFRAGFTDTVAALANDVGLRIGTRVRAGAPQSGEPYVVKPVLEPGTMFLMGSGLLGISVWARRRWARRR
jgi:hypothetical protein